VYLYVTGPSTVPGFTELDPTDLDGIVERLRQHPNVSHASWNASTQS
jgi:hypothetical protein